MQALVKVGAAYIPPFGYNPPMLGGAGSQPFDVVVRMDGLGKFSDEWKRAIEIKVGGCASRFCRSNAFWPASRPPIVQKTCASSRFCRTHCARCGRRKHACLRNRRAKNESRHLQRRRRETVFEAAEYSGADLTQRKCVKRFADYPHIRRMIHKLNKAFSVWVNMACSESHSSVN
jgi:hypothetical protein